jgi:predicted dehydrogenase
MKQFGVGIIGTGSVSGEYFKAFSKNPHTEVIAITSRDRERAKAKAAEHGLKDCALFTDPYQMINDKSVDIVTICTPHNVHAEQGISSAKAGKHIVVEKPIAITLESLRDLDQAIRSAGVKSVVSFVLRWNPMFDNIRAILDQNLAGRLYYAEVDYLHGISPAYKIWEWMSRKELGGSAMLSAGCHAVDALRWFVRDEAVEVSAYSNRSQGNEFQYEYDPNLVTIIRFASGAIGKVACSIECRMPYVFNVELFGDRGTIRNNQLFTTQWPGQQGWASIPTTLPDSGAVSHHPFQIEIDHFIECIRTGKESHANVADAVKTHEICLAADLSTAASRPVRLPLS